MTAETFTSVGLNPPKMFDSVEVSVDRWLAATDAFESESAQAAARLVIRDYVVSQMGQFPSDEQLAVLGRVQAAYEYVA